MATLFAGDDVPALDFPTNRFGIQAASPPCEALREPTRRGGGSRHLLLDHPLLADQLRAFLDCGLALDPWLTGLTEETYSFTSQDRIARTAAGMSGQYWREPLITETLGTIPVLKTQGQRAVLETLTSTAAAIAHERLGRIAVDDAIAGEAQRRLQGFVDHSCFGALVRIVMVVQAADNLAALTYYRRLSEQEFVSGIRHRPWARAPLDNQLVVGVARGTYASPYTTACAGSAPPRAAGACWPVRRDCWRSRASWLSG